MLEWGRHAKSHGEPVRAVLPGLGPVVLTSRGAAAGNRSWEPAGASPQGAPVTPVLLLITTAQHMRCPLCRNSFGSFDELLGLVRDAGGSRDERAKRRSLHHGAWPGSCEENGVRIHTQTLVRLHANERTRTLTASHGLAQQAPRVSSAASPPSRRSSTSAMSAQPCTFVTPALRMAATETTPSTAGTSPMPTGGGCLGVASGTAFWSSPPPWQVSNSRSTPFLQYACNRAGQPIGSCCRRASPKHCSSASSLTRTTKRCFCWTRGARECRAAGRFEGLG